MYIYIIYYHTLREVDRNQILSLSLSLSLSLFTMAMDLALVGQNAQFIIIIVISMQLCIATDIIT